MLLEHRLKVTGVLWSDVNSQAQECELSGMSPAGGAVWGGLHNL